MKNIITIYIAGLLIACLIYSCELDSAFANGEVPTISNLAISSPNSLSCELPCSLTFTASSDLTFPANPGDQVSYTWDFGDGSTAVSGNNVTHEYTVDGEYDITLTATAPNASEVSITPKFIVSPDSEVATISELVITSPDPLSCELPCMATFSASSTFMFPDNPGDEVSYTWNFDDGTNEETGNDIMHEYLTVGEYNITLTASAPGAQDVSIMENFSVSPKSSFVASTTNGFLGMDVAETSDGFIVFGIHNVVKFDKQGNFIKSADARNFLDGFLYGDYHQISEDNFLLVAYDGMRANLDSNLNFSNIAISAYGETTFVTAVVLQDQELYQLGYTNEGFYPPTPLIPIGSISFSADPDYVINGYNYAGGDMNYPSGRPSKHIQIGDEYYFPLFSFTNGSEIYAYNQSPIILSNLSIGNIPRSITDGENNNILVLTYGESFELVLQELDKTSGTAGVKTELCPQGGGELPQGVVKTSDGYVVLTSFNQFATCNGNFTVNTQTMRIRKFDFQYDLVWDKLIEIENAADTFAEVIKESESGGFLITGTYKQSGFDQLFLIKTTADGEVIQ